MPDFKSILIVQTAFVGDVILTLPLAQALKRHFAAGEIDMLVTPQASELLIGHPVIRRAIVFDKRGTDAGLRGLFRIAAKVRQNQYDIALVPHRSLRSAALVCFALIPRRIGFRTSAGRILFTDRVIYDRAAHEVDRNLALLSPLLLKAVERERPILNPSSDDQQCVSAFLSEHGIPQNAIIAGIAPGTVWNTKRWLPERFEGVARALVADGCYVVLIAGPNDVALCEEIERAVPGNFISSAAGRLSLLQSAELIRRCRVLITNDSAPMHLATAMGTPIVAIFGATVPGFGFAPVGKDDRVIEVKGLSCRPCSIHGGNRCPISTFDCMEKITIDQVMKEVQAVLSRG